MLLPTVNGRVVVSSLNSSWMNHGEHREPRGAGLAGRALAAAFAASLAPLALPTPSAAQERDIVASRVEVSNEAASLGIEYSDGSVLGLRMVDGDAYLNGERLGAYEPGGAADRAWRELLDRVLSLSDAGLARELEAWSPDPAPAGPDAQLLRQLQAALAGASTGASAARAARTRAQEREELLVEDELARLTELARLRALESLGALQELQEMESVVDMDELREEIHAEVRREVEEELARSQAARESDSDRGWLGGLAARTSRAAGDLMETAVGFLLMAAFALLLTRFAGHRLDSVTREIGSRPGRAAAVGVAGGFLALPLFIVGIVVLAVTIVGILLLPFWAALYPLAVAAGVLVGCVGVSHHIGRWVLDQGIPWLDGVDRSRAVNARLVGLAALMTPAAVGAVLKAVPVLGWIGFVVEGVGMLGGAVAAAVGLGAVIVTRGGRDDGAWRYDFGAEPQDDDFGADVDFAGGGDVRSEPRDVHSEATHGEPDDAFAETGDPHAEQHEAEAADEDRRNA